MKTPRVRWLLVVLASCFFLGLNWFPIGGSSSRLGVSSKKRSMPLCVGGSMMKTEKLTLWTMLNDDGATDEIAGIAKLIRRANLKLQEPYTPWILEDNTNSLSPTARRMLLGTGWNICTLVDGFDPKLALRALWGMRGIDRIIYLDSKSYISGDINALASIPLEGVKLAAGPKYKANAWTSSLSISTMVIAPCDESFSELNRASSASKTNSFEEFINTLYPTEWYDLSYKYGFNTEILNSEPDYFKFKRAHFRVVSFPSVPWNACVCFAVLEKKRDFFFFFIGVGLM